MPKPIEDTEASFDSSTPVQYDNENSGIIELVRVGDMTLGAKITDNLRKKYNILIDKYKIQFSEENSIDLSSDLGVKPITDSYGNPLWYMDAESLQYLLRLKRWEKEGRPSDSLWAKAKEYLK